MFNRVKYFITNSFNKTFKEGFIKNKKKYNQPSKKTLVNIVIRKYHSSNTNASKNEPPNNFTGFIICTIILGSYFKIYKKIN
jgi:hypothetical protein